MCTAHCPAAQAFPLHHPAQIAKRGRRADGVLENRHDADAIWNQRGGQERKHPDKDASERIKCVASDRGRTQKGKKAVAVQPAAQDAARFKDKGKRCSIKSPRVTNLPP